MTEPQFTKIGDDLYAVSLTEVQGLQGEVIEKRGLYFQSSMSPTAVLHEFYENEAKFPSLTSSFLEIPSETEGSHELWTILKKERDIGNIHFEIVWITDQKGDDGYPKKFDIEEVDTFFKLMDR